MAVRRPLVNITGTIQELPVGDSVAGGGSFAGLLGSLVYSFDTATNGSPASGKVQFNNATPSAATLVYLHETDGLGVNVDQALDSMDIGDNIWVFSTAAQTYHVFKVVAPFTSGASIDSIPVAYMFGTGTLTASEAIGVHLEDVPQVSISKSLGIDMRAYSL
jgi:hypothetical protein